MLRLTVGPKADLLAPAQRLLAALCTIGPALEARVSELYRAGEPLLSYLLDCAGVLALGKVGEAVRRLAEERAAERGWGVSPALSSRPSRLELQQQHHQPLQHLPFTSSSPELMTGTA